MAIFAGKKGAKTGDAKASDSKDFADQRGKRPVFGSEQNLLGPESILQISVEQFSSKAQISPWSWPGRAATWILPCLTSSRQESSRAIS